MLQNFYALNTGNAAVTRQKISLQKIPSSVSSYTRITQTFFATISKLTLWIVAFNALLAKACAVYKSGLHIMFLVLSTINSLASLKVFACNINWAHCVANKGLLAPAYVVYWDIPKYYLETTVLQQCFLVVGVLIYGENCWVWMWWNGNVVYWWFHTVGLMVGSRRDFIIRCHYIIFIVGGSSFCCFLSNEFCQKPSMQQISHLEGLVVHIVHFYHRSARGGAIA